MKLPAAAVLLVVVAVTPAAALQGFGEQAVGYFPYCATACHRALGSNYLSRSFDGYMLGGMMDSDAASATPACRAATCRSLPHWPTASARTATTTWASSRRGGPARRPAPAGTSCRPSIPTRRRCEMSLPANARHQPEGQPHVCHARERDQLQQSEGHVVRCGPRGVCAREVRV